MRKIFFLVVVLNFFVQQLLSQVTPPRADYIVDRNTGIIRELKTKPEEEAESVYLDDEWRTGSFTFKTDQVVEDVPLKYDLKNDVLEIQTTSGVKVAGRIFIKKIEFNQGLTKKILINTDDLHIKNLGGIGEELVAGKLSLYAMPYVEKIPSNYNAALNIGEKTAHFNVEEKLFLAKEGEAFDVTKSGKKILTYFDDKSGEIENFVKSHRLSYKNKADLIEIIHYYNGLNN